MWVALAREQAATSSAHRFRDRGLQKTPFCVGIEHSASLNLAIRPRICPRLRIAELKRLAWSSKLGKPSKKSIYKKTLLQLKFRSRIRRRSGALAWYKTPEKGVINTATHSRVSLCRFSSPTAPNVAQTARENVPLARSYVHLAGRRWLQCWAL